MCTHVFRAGCPGEVFGHVARQDVVHQDLIDLLISLNLILLMLDAHLAQKV